MAPLDQRKQQQQERQLLADFLRTRRARVSPAEYGLDFGRRRTPGLRREEVADIAGISPTWYTWLEQGRDVQASAQVLERIAFALKLEPHETQYLLTLANVAPEHDGTQAASTQTRESVTSAVRQLLDHQQAYPAYVLGRFWDFLAWNEAADQLFGGFSTMSEAHQNMISYVFLRPETRTLLPNWGDRAQAITAEFRADCSQYAADPYFVQRVDRFKAQSLEFAEMWERHDVRPRVGGLRTFNHPSQGWLEYEQVTLTISNVPGIKIVVLLTT